MERCKYCGELLTDKRSNLCEKHRTVPEIKALVKEIDSMDNNPFEGQELYLSLEQIENLFYMVGRTKKEYEKTEDEETKEYLQAMYKMLTASHYAAIAQVTDNPLDIGVLDWYDSGDYDILTPCPLTANKRKKKARVLCAIMRRALDDPEYTEDYFRWDEKKMRIATAVYIKEHEE